MDGSIIDLKRIKPTQRFSRNARESTDIRRDNHLFTMLRSKTIDKNASSTFDITTRPTTTFKRSLYFKQQSVNSLHSFKSGSNQISSLLPNSNNLNNQNTNLNLTINTNAGTHNQQGTLNPNNNQLNNSTSLQNPENPSESPGKKSILSSNKLNNKTNEITFRERKMIRNMKTHFSKREGNLSGTTLNQDLNFPGVKTLKTGSSISKPKESITHNNKENNSLLRKLIQMSPYHNIPKSVKFSYTNDKEIEKQYLPNLKGHCLTKEGNHYKQVFGGSTTIFFNKSKSKEKESILKKLLTVKSEVTASFKKSIKWKNLKWLLNHKTGYVDLIINSYKDMAWFIKSRNAKINTHLFEELMSLISDKTLKIDKEFNEYIFLIFDEDRDGVLDFNEVVTGLLFFREEIYQNKIAVLTDLCLIEENTNKVSLEEFFRLVRGYIFNKKDLKKLHDLMRATSRSKDNLIDKRMFYDFMVSSEEVKSIFQRSMENVAEKENYYEEEINAISKSNLKSSKMSANPDIGMCPNDYTVFEKILQIRNSCLVDKKKNFKMGFLENDTINSEDENK